MHIVERLTNTPLQPRHIYHMTQEPSYQFLSSRSLNFNHGLGIKRKTLLNLPGHPRLKLQTICVLNPLFKFELDLDYLHDQPEVLSFQVLSPHHVLLQSDHKFFNHDLDREQLCSFGFHSVLLQNKVFNLILLSKDFPPLATLQLL